LYLSDVSELISHPELATVSHAIRQAWRELGLSGVLCIDHQPCAYIKEQKRFTADQKERLVKFVWNQGTAPQLILIDESKVEVYSSLARPPGKSGQAWAPESLVETLETLGKGLEAQSLSMFLKRLETGQLYRDHPEKFNPEQAVDKNLLLNLRHLRDQLKKAGSQDLEHLHALLGRLLFIRFLEAREFIGASHFPGRATGLQSFFDRYQGDPEKGIELLYNKLFKSLQKEFNGSMFSTELEEERQQLTPDGFLILSCFFRGDEMDSGQTVLPFGTYDFSTIPVETISAIYEDFLEAEDSQGRNALGAYYTPRHLAEMVVNLAIRDGKHVADWKFLDPSCGSGVFLVIAFNLLAEHWLYRAEVENSRRHKGTKINQLIEILSQQIRGIDLNQTACRIAAFSLYLALFEKVRPVDLEEFKKKLSGKPVLPNLLKVTPLNGDNTAIITCADFNDHPTNYPKNFDRIIGNPPWKGRGQTQQAFPFADQAGEFLKTKGQSCLLLPTSMLVLKNGTLNREWFLNHSVTEIINLADYQRILFTGPEVPSMILHFSSVSPPHDHTIRYYTPTLNRYDPRQGLIPIEPNDLKPLNLSDIANCSSNEDFRLLWVVNFCGSQRDQAFLSRLRRMPKLGRCFENQSGDENLPQLIKGVGFKPFYPGETKDTPQPLSPWHLSNSYLASDQLPELIAMPQSWEGSTLRTFLSNRISRKGTPASTTQLRTRPKEAIFTPPMVLLNEGFTKAAFCKHKVRFQHSIHSISGSRKFSSSLKLLTAFMNSDLARYFTFFCSPGWMAGRKRVNFDDKMRLPFPMPESPHAGRKASEALSEIESLFDSLEERLQKTAPLDDQSLTDDTKATLNELIFDYYGITASEQILIKDTLEIWAPSTRKRPHSKNIPALTAPSLQEVNDYGKTICRIINAWAKASNSGFRLRMSDTLQPSSLRLRLLTLSITKADAPSRRRKIHLKESTQEFHDALEKIEAALTGTEAPFQYLRGLTFYDGNRILILKPNTLRHWAKSIAMNDADEIIAHQTQTLAGKDSITQ